MNGSDSRSKRNDVYTGLQLMSKSSLKNVTVSGESVIHRPTKKCYPSGSFHASSILSRHDPRHGRRLAHR